MRRLAAMTLVISALGCGPRPTTVPATDACDTPSGGSIDALDVGAATPDDLAGHPTTFAPLGDGDGVSLIQGGQGATMLGFILRVSGSTAPTCLGQQTTVTGSDGARVIGSNTPVATYAQADGTRVTHPMWLPAQYPSTFVVAVTAAGRSISLHLHLTP